jgi:uncharacterized protein (TIGR02996 family)
MRRFEYKDAKSHKFWEIDLDGDAFTVRYGKFGTSGQVQTKTFASSDKAEAEAEKLIKSKTKKGYVELEVDAKAQANAQAVTAQSGARNPALEAAIVDAPTDIGAWQVYADWLQAQGDPWGERISLGIQCDQAKGAAKTKLAKQITTYEAEHAESLYGKSLVALMKKDFERVADVSATYGLFMTATVKTPEYDWSGTAPSTVLGALIKSPASRLLRSLNVGMLDHEYPVSLAKGIDAITKAGKLESLRELFLGDFEYPDENEISWVAVGNVAKVWPVVPQLRSLRLRGAEIKLGALEHPTLESLTIETGGLPSAAVASIGKSKLPQLQRMEVWLGTEEYGGTGKCSQLAGLFQGAGVPKLEHLGLQNSDFQDDIAKALAKSKLLAQLTSVDLSMGTMREPGARAILANVKAFSHLRSLDLSDNYIPDDLAAQLRAAFGDRVMIGEQREPDGDDDDAYYYTSVGE